MNYGIIVLVLFVLIIQVYQLFIVIPQFVRTIHMSAEKNIISINSKAENKYHQYQFEGSINFTFLIKMWISYLKDCFWLFKYVLCGSEHGHNNHYSSSAFTSHKLNVVSIFMIISNIYWHITNKSLLNECILCIPLTELFSNKLTSLLYKFAANFDPIEEQ